MPRPRYNTAEVISEFLQMNTNIALIVIEPDDTPYRAYMRLYQYIRRRKLPIRVVKRRERIFLVNDIRDNV